MRFNAVSEWFEGDSGWFGRLPNKAKNEGENCGFTCWRVGWNTLAGGMLCVLLATSAFGGCKRFHGAFIINLARHLYFTNKNQPYIYKSKTCFYMWCGTKTWMEIKSTSRRFIWTQYFLNYNLIFWLNNLTHQKSERSIMQKKTRLFVFYFI